MNISFAYPWVLYGGFPLVCCALLWRWKVRKPVMYRFPLVHAFMQSDVGNKYTTKNVLMPALRFIMVSLLLLATARPRSADERSQINVEGIAAMLVLDVSGSMDCFDDLNNQKSRFEIAQEELLNLLIDAGMTNLAWFCLVQLLHLACR